VQRIEECFEHLEQKAKTKPCKGMKGLLEEGRDMLEEDMEDAVMDAAIASGGRKIEHYEMVAYESLRGIAEPLQLNEIAELLGESFEEEREADQTLTEICQRMVEEAASGSEEEGEEMDEEDEEGGGGPKGGRGQTVGARGRRVREAGGRSYVEGQVRRTYGWRFGKRTTGGEHGRRPLIDHDEIQEWAEEREAQPACVKGTAKGDTCLLRLDFPGYTGEDSLEPIEWDQWFEHFDQKKLALLVQDTTASGEPSNFNKLVSRENLGAKQQRPESTCGALVSQARYRRRKLQVLCRSSGGSKSSSNSGFFAKRFQHAHNPSPVRNPARNRRGMQRQILLLFEQSFPWGQPVFTPDPIFDQGTLVDPFVHLTHCPFWQSWGATRRLAQILYHAGAAEPVIGQARGGECFGEAGDRPGIHRP